eukprot:CAMPEP_0170234102 /NCGR_PEP_ID=MMETSP0116_2-20130129/16797_1 /TAXON_ID=400756 /ORGANISM="Durinskia baltica, Strain CSIRO CS-38" /LENGTH=209 /DNA_ID=CAMNT_0010484897 /DNA_START=52 /DNA_END=681 /DNA_ORIENTATION=-
MARVCRVCSMAALGFLTAVMLEGCMQSKPSDDRPDDRRDEDDRPDDRRDEDAALVQQALDEGVVDNEVRLHAIALVFKSGLVAKATLIGVVVGFLVFAGPSIGLKLLGFGASGVARGSVAAAIQATFPLVARGTWFAWAQSVSMSGAAWLPTTGLITGAGAWFEMAGRRIAVFSDQQLLELLVRYSLVDERMRSLLSRALDLNATNDSG